MKQLTKAAALLMCCSLAACGSQKHVEFLPIPQERIDCVHVAKRPALPPEDVIDWQQVEAAPNVTTAVAVAKGEVAKMMATVRDREGRVAGYILDVEGEVFACSNDAQWIRDYQAEMAKK